MGIIKMSLLLRKDIKFELFFFCKEKTRRLFNFSIFFYNKIEEINKIYIQTLRKEKEKNNLCACLV